MLLFVQEAKRRAGNDESVDHGVAAVMSDDDLNAADSAAHLLSRDHCEEKEGADENGVHVELCSDLRQEGVISRDKKTVNTSNL